jgi:hypothetical protein
VLRSRKSLLSRKSKKEPTLTLNVFKGDFIAFAVASATPGEISKKKLLLLARDTMTPQHPHILCSGLISWSVMRNMR